MVNWATSREIRPKLHSMHAHKWGRSVRETEGLGKGVKSWLLETRRTVLKILCNSRHSRQQETLTFVYKNSN
uniref:Uncharacterized protein n=1 Tax=Rhizophora mucronata TaxID=61149 RepID=A0A2P2QR59_RHIMU